MCHLGVTNPTWLPPETGSSCRPRARHARLSCCSTSAGLTQDGRVPGSYCFDRLSSHCVPIWSEPRVQ